MASAALHRELAARASRPPAARRRVPDTSAGGTSGGRADRARGARPRRRRGVARGSSVGNGRTAASGAPSGRVEGPTDCGARRTRRSTAPRRARALEFAVAHRGLPLPEHGRPDAAGLGLDGRHALVRRADVPRAHRGEAGDAGATDGSSREAMRLLEEWQCVGRRLEPRGRARPRRRSFPATRRRRRSRSSPSRTNASRSSAPGSSSSAESWRREPGGLTVAQALVAFRLHGVRRRGCGGRAPRSRTIARRRAFLGRPSRSPGRRSRPARTSSSTPFEAGA